MPSLVPEPPGDFPQPNFSILLFFGQHFSKHFRIIICEVPLVACANWKRVMFVLSGKLNVTSVDELRSANVHGTGLGGKYLKRLSTYSKEEMR